MVPECTAVGHFVKLCNTHTVLIGRHMLCGYIHCDFTKIEICSYTCGGGNTRFRKHFLYEHTGKIVSVHSACFKIGGSINKHFVNAVNVDILRCDMAEIHLINPCAVLNIKCHPRWCNNIINGKRRISFKLIIIIRLAFKPSARSFFTPLCVGNPDLLNQLKHSGSAGNTVAFKAWRNRKAYCFFCSRRVDNNNICCHGVKPPFHCLNTGIERFEVDCNIRSVHSFTSCPSAIIPPEIENFNIKSNICAIFLEKLFPATIIAGNFII